VQLFTPAMLPYWAFPQAQFKAAYKDDYDYNQRLASPSDGGPFHIPSWFLESDLFMFVNTIFDSEHISQSIDGIEEARRDAILKGACCGCGKECKSKLHRRHRAMRNKSLRAAWQQGRKSKLDEKCMASHGEEQYFIEDNDITLRVLTPRGVSAPAPITLDRMLAGEVLRQRMSLRLSEDLSALRLESGKVLELNKSLISQGLKDGEVVWPILPLGTQISQSSSSSQHMYVTVQTSDISNEPEADAGTSIWDFIMRDYDLLPDSYDSFISGGTTIASSISARMGQVFETVGINIVATSIFARLRQVRDVVDSFNPPLAAEVDGQSLILQICGREQDYIIILHLDQNLPEACSGALCFMCVDVILCCLSLALSS